MISIAYDTETTGLTLPEGAGLDKQPKIIEFALILLDDSSGKQEIVGEATWLINPRQSLSEEITKITGLKDADLRGKPEFVEVLPEISDWFLGVERLYAHNLPFDLQMLINELRRADAEYAFPYPPRQVCTAQLSEELGVEGARGGNRLRLIQLYEHCFGEKLEQTHRALDDVRAMVKCIQHLGW